MVAYAPTRTRSDRHALLHSTDLPPGYQHTPLDPCADRPLTGGACSCRAERWVAPASVPPGSPLMVDAGVTTFATVTAALRFFTDPPPLPEGMSVRRLFPPTIGAGSRAFRMETTREGIRYAIYRVDAVNGRRVVTVAAVWRWPSGSPNDCYGWARGLTDRFA